MAIGGSDGIAGVMETAAARGHPRPPGRCAFAGESVDRPPGCAPTPEKMDHARSQPGSASPDRGGPRAGVAGRGEGYEDREGLAGPGARGGAADPNGDEQTTNRHEPDDGTLLAQAGNGDRDAYMMLYQRYERRVYGLVVTLVGRGAAADDAFQEAMWELWRRASSYDARLGSATSWILMLARSRAIDVARRRTRVNRLQGALEERARGSSEFGAAGLSGQGLGTGSAMDAEEPDLRALGARAMGLLGALPKEQQVVVRMAFMQGMTREQIASALGVPVGTVKTRLRTAVRTLGGQMAAGVGVKEQDREENGNH